MAWPERGRNGQRAVPACLTTVTRNITPDHDFVLAEDGEKFEMRRGAATPKGGMMPRRNPAFFLGRVRDRFDGDED